MRQLLKILLHVFLFIGLANSVKAQKPSGFPITNSTGWIKYGYLQADSGLIVASRDTSWKARYPGTLVFWQHAGVDSLYWFYDGGKWNKFSAEGSSGKDTVFVSGPLYVVHNTLTGKDTIFIHQAGTSQDGYLSSTDWNTFNNKQNAITVTTTGSSGPATLVGATLNIPQYTGGSGTVTDVTASSPIIITGSHTVTPNITVDTSTAITGLATLYQNSLKQDRTNFFGKIYDSTGWANLGSFTNNGGTFSVSGGKIVASGGTGFTSTLDLNYYTSLERYKYFARVKATSGTGGFGVGTRSANSYVPSSLCGWFNTATGRCYINAGVALSTTFDSSAILAFSTNDSIELWGERKVDVFTVYARNKTTNSAIVSVSYTYPLDQTASIALPNTGKFAFYTINNGANTQTIDSISITSTEIRSADIVMVGDSKLTGYSAGSFSNRMSQKLQTHFHSTIISDGFGDLTQDVINKLPQLISFNSRYAFINIGRNDIAQGITTATIYDNYDTIVARLQRAGTTVFHILPFWEPHLNQDGLVAHIYGTYPLANIINTFDITKIPGAIAIDSVHISELGNDLAYQRIIAKFGLTGADNNNTFKDGSGITNHGNYPDWGGNITSQVDIIENSHFNKHVFWNGMRLGVDTSSNNNTYLLSANSFTGINNTASGKDALSFSIGNSNVANGLSAGTNNNGDNNTFTGTLSGYGHTGSNNTITGYGAGFNGASLGNTLTGFGAGQLNTKDYLNAHGLDAANSNSGLRVNADGTLSLKYNTGDDATASGFESLYQNTGHDAIGIGSQSGISNSFNNVSLFGTSATATADKQIIFKNGSYNWRLASLALTADRLDTVPDFSGRLAVSSGAGANYNQVLESKGNTVSTWSYAPIVRASGDSLSKTATTTICTYTNISNVASYQVSAYADITAIAGGGILTFTVTYTDIHSNLRTATFYQSGSATAGLTTTGSTNFPVLGEFRVIAFGVITVTATLTVGTATFDASASIIQLR